MNFDLLLAFCGATALLALSPGPDNMYVLMQSLVHGVKDAFWTIIGLMSGCLVHTSLVAFGVSALIKNNEHIFLGMKLLGVGYLLYLAYSVFKAPSEISLQSSSGKKQPFSLLKQGFLMNVLNPKVTIFFLAFFPGFLFSDTMSTVVQFYTLGTLFILVSFLIFSCYAILAVPFSTVIRQSNVTRVMLKWMQIIVFFGIAMYLLFSTN